MLKIDEPGNVDGQFVIAAPGQPPTRLGAKWPNTVQSELIAIALAQPGTELDQTGATTNQVLSAIEYLIGVAQAAAESAAAAEAAAAQAAAQMSSLQKAQNLADLASLPTAWTNLGVGITTNGNGSYLKIGPLMIMWGNAIGNSTAARDLPAAFSDYSKAQIITGNSDAQGANNDVVFAYLLSNSTYYFGSKQTNGGSAESGYPGSWIAIGPA